MFSKVKLTHMFNKSRIHYVKVRSKNLLDDFEKEAILWIQNPFDQNKLKYSVPALNPAYRASNELGQGILSEFPPLAVC